MAQKKIEENGHLFIEVPKGAKKFVLAVYDGLNLVWDLPDGLRRGFEELPPGSYTLVGLGSELTEAQWEPIVKKISYFDKRKLAWKTVAYVDYTNSNSWDIKTKKESGFSLLASKSLSPNTTVILKNNDK